MAVAGVGIGIGINNIPIGDGYNVGDALADFVYDNFIRDPAIDPFTNGKGERNWEKGRGDDWMWDLTPDELREIERDPKSTPNERERAKRIRKQKEKKCK